MIKINGVEYLEVEPTGERARAIRGTGHHGAIVEAACNGFFKRRGLDPKSLDNFRAVIAADAARAKAFRTKRIRFLIDNRERLEQLEAYSQW